MDKEDGIFKEPYVFLKRPFVKDAICEIVPLISFLVWWLLNVAVIASLFHLVASYFYNLRVKKEIFSRKNKKKRILNKERNKMNWIIKDGKNNVRVDLRIA